MVGGMSQRTCQVCTYAQGSEHVSTVMLVYIRTYVRMCVNEEGNMNNFLPAMYILQGEGLLSICTYFCINRNVRTLE